MIADPLKDIFVKMLNLSSPTFFLITFLNYKLPVSQHSNLIVWLLIFIIML